MIPYRIYLSGGGVCAVAHVGALIELSKHIPLKAVKEWMGVSAGSLVAMCLAIGFTLEELYDFCVRFDFTHIKETDSVPGWILHFGLDTGERLHRLIDACLKVKGLSTDLTFKECYDQFGIVLRIVVTDMNDDDIRDYCPEKTPHYKISNAVRASMTFPYYFQPFICPESGHYLIDGGVISNYPLFLLSKEEQAKTLSLLIQTTVEKAPSIETLELDRLFIRPLYIALTHKSSIECQLYDTKCIRILLGQVNILDFSFDDETKNKIICAGEEAVQSFFRFEHMPLRRRNSI